MSIFNSPRETEKSAAVQSIIEGSEPSREYYILVGLSVALATLAILLQNDTVLIGSMLVAPLLYPLLAVALGIATLDTPLILRSTVIVARSLLLAISVAAAVTLLFLGSDRVAVLGYVATNFIPSYLQLAVGVVAGLAATFALTKQSLANAIPGVAISVALIPPLAATGVSISYFNWELFLNSAILFFSNILGIVIASAALFVFLNFRSQNLKIDKSLQQEEKELELDV